MGFFYPQILLGVWHVPMSSWAWHILNWNKRKGLYLTQFKEKKEMLFKYKTYYNKIYIKIFSHGLIDTWLISSWMTTSFYHLLNPYGSKSSRISLRYQINKGTGVQKDWQPSSCRLRLLETYWNNSKTTLNMKCSIPDLLERGIMRMRLYPGHMVIRVQRLLRDFIKNPQKLRRIAVSHLLPGSVK